MIRKISQTEARRLKKQVQDLKSQLAISRLTRIEDWSTGWVNLESLTFGVTEWARIDTARRLGHPVVAVTTSNNVVRFYAETGK
jgi:hypothetical protein